MNPIYLDYNATTPIDPAVRQAVVGGLDLFGNPSSTHPFGVAARAALDTAREQVARRIGAAPDEVVFTGGGSEASNHAIKGVAFRAGLPDCHIITSAVEHPATLQPCRFLESLGCRLTVLPVDRFGQVDPDDVRRAITPTTRLISIMHSNNEVGTLNPVPEIARIGRERGVLVHTDAAQSVGKVPVEVTDLGVDLLTIAGHKLYAPKGVGALYVRRGVELTSLIHGAGHERGRRAGTENVPYLMALGLAAELAEPAADRLRTLRDRLHAGLGDRVVLNGHPEHRLPNTLNVSFRGHVGWELLGRVPGIAASTGSACHEGRATVSPVLAGMGVPVEIGQGAIRLSVGRFTTEAEVDQAAALLIRASAGE